MKFEEFPFIPALHKAVQEIGFVDCTPVQEQSFKAYFEEKDIYAQSQTGTGKTAAFMLCGLQELYRRNQARIEITATTRTAEASKEIDQEASAEANPETDEANLGAAFETSEAEVKFAGDIKMLVLSPTRELAEQIEQEAKLLAQFLNLEVAAFYGGVGYEKQHADLDSGVQIITGTPGRIIDLAKSGQLPLDQVQVMVLDEADRMLDMGFIDDVRWIMGKLPAINDRLTMLYSATLNAKIGNLTWEFMRTDRMAEIVIEPEQITTENVQQELYHVSNQEKLRLLLSLIKKHDPESALIFCNTKSGATFLEGRLQANGYPDVKALMGDLAQVKRNQIVGQLKAGKLRFVVATDVASRGLHIEGLPLVINYDLPDEAENYVHRIGRTARAGASGRAISLACERYVYNLADIERYIESKIPVAWYPEDELVEDLGRGRNRNESEPHRERQGRSRGNRESQSSDDRGNRSEGGSRRRSSSSHERGERGERGERSERNPEDQERNGERASRYGERKERGTERGSSKGFSREFSKELPKDKDERLKYYQQKYGENFGAEGGAEAAKLQESGRSSNHRRGGNGSRKRNEGGERNTDRAAIPTSQPVRNSGKGPNSSGAPRKRRSGQGRAAGDIDRKPEQGSETAKRSGQRKPHQSSGQSHRHDQASRKQPNRHKNGGSPTKAPDAVKPKKPSLLQRLFGKK